MARTDGKALERAPIAVEPVYSIVSEPPGRRNAIGFPQTPHLDALEVQLRESRFPCRVGYASGRLLALPHNLVRILPSEEAWKHCIESLRPPLPFDRSVQPSVSFVNGAPLKTGGGVVPGPKSRARLPLNHSYCCRFFFFLYDDEAFGYLKRVIVTPAVYPSLVGFRHFNIQSTGQKSRFVYTLWHQQIAMF